MSGKKSTYSIPQIVLHWAIAVLIVANYIVSDGMGSQLDKHLEDSSAATSWAGTFHIYVGLAVIGLVVLRLIVRIFSTKPEPINTGHHFFDRLSQWVHDLLYLLMFLVPVFGATAWYLGIETMGDVHVIAMNIMMSIVILHTLAALYHHHILKDRLLLRMVGRSQ